MGTEGLQIQTVATVRVGVCFNIEINQGERHETR